MDSRQQVQKHCMSGLSILSLGTSGTCYNHWGQMKNTSILAISVKHSPATLVHLLWSFPNLQDYWTKISEVLHKAFDVSFTPEPVSTIFSTPPDNLPVTLQRALRLYKPDASFLWNGNTSHLHPSIDGLQKFYIALDFFKSNAKKIIRCSHSGSL